MMRDQWDEDEKITWEPENPMDISGGSTFNTIDLDARDDEDDKDHRDEKETERERAEGAEGAG